MLTYCASIDEKMTVQELTELLTEVSDNVVCHRQSSPFKGKKLEQLLPELPADINTVILTEALVDNNTYKPTYLYEKKLKMRCMMGWLVYGSSDAKLKKREADLLKKSESFIPVATLSDPMKARLQKALDEAEFDYFCAHAVDAIKRDDMAQERIKKGGKERRVAYNFMINHPWLYRKAFYNPLFYTKIDWLYEDNIESFFCTLLRAFNKFDIDSKAAIPLSCIERIIHRYNDEDYSIINEPYSSLDPDNPLDFAIRLKNKALIELFVKHNGKPNYETHFRHEMITALLDDGATVYTYLDPLFTAGTYNPNQLENNLNVLHTLASFNYPRYGDNYSQYDYGNAIQFLQKYVNIYSPDATPLQRTPLHHAIICENERYAQALLAYGADVNKQDAQGIAPLHLAYELDNDSLITLLENYGADQTIRDVYGKIPAAYSAVSRKIKQIFSCCTRS